MPSYGSTPLPTSDPKAGDEAKPFVSTRQLVVGVAVCATLVVAGVVGLKDRECFPPYLPCLLSEVLSSTIGTRKNFSKPVVYLVSSTRFPNSHRQIHDSPFPASSLFSFPNSQT